MKKIANLIICSIVIINFFVFKTNAKEDILKLSLKDAVILTNKNNREINNAKLKRKSEQFDLLVENDKFRPDISVSTSIERKSDIDNKKNVTKDSNVIDQYKISTSVDLKLKTGAQLSMKWDGIKKRNYSTSMDYADNSGNDSRKKNYNQLIDFRINQPLAKNSGLKVNTSSLEIAEINDKISKLTLKKTQIDIITQAIIIYRNLLYAQKQYEICNKSLNISIKQYKFNKKLVEKGRMASLDLVQSENDVANKKIDLILSENQLQQKKFDLIKILDIDTNTPIYANENLSITDIPNTISLDYRNLIIIAFLNNPDLLIRQAQQKKSEIDYMLASNAKKFDISLIAGYSIDNEFNHLTNTLGKNYDNRSTSWDVGILFNHTFGDLSDDQNYYRAKINLKIAKNNVVDMKEDIQIQLKNIIQEVKIRKKQIELSKKARLLSEKKLAIELKKLDMGRSSNFQIVSFQNDLVKSETIELLAIIDYYNAITQLEQIIGITLSKWTIKNIEP